jgi:hypothetical protein
MQAVRTAFDVEIEAPDGASALELEWRLAHLSPRTVAHGPRWTVEVPAVEYPAELEAIVRRWLDEIGVPATGMRLDGRRIRLTGYREGRRQARVRRPNADFIG